MSGEKHDSGKPDWSLLPLKQVEEIVRVLSFGAEKYDRDNWQKVPDAKNRYFAAAMRHLTEYQAGHNIDKESQLPHLAHAACCLVFLLWFEDAVAKPENPTMKLQDDGIFPVEKARIEASLQPCCSCGSKDLTLTLDIMLGDRRSNQIHCNQCNFFQRDTDVGHLINYWNTNR